MRHEWQRARQTRADRYRHPGTNDDHQRQHQHGRVEPREADADARDFHLTAAAQQDAQDQAGQTHDRQVDERARPDAPDHRWPRFDRDHRVAGHESGPQQAVDRVIDVAEKGPRHGRASRARQAHRRLRVHPVHQPAENREGRGEGQAEVLGSARAHERGESEEQPAQPRGRHVPGPLARVDIHRVAAHHATREHEYVERPDDANERDERKGEDIGERRVVVERERNRRTQREDFGRKKRQVMVRDDLVPEHPQVPDVHTRIAVWQPQQCVCETQRQWPRKSEGDTHVSEQRCGLSPQRRGRHWRGVLNAQLGLKATATSARSSANRLRQCAAEVQHGLNLEHIHNSQLNKHLQPLIRSRVARLETHDMFVIATWRRPKSLIH